MRNIESPAAANPTAGKESLEFTSPMADADMDGPASAPRARLVDGLVFCPVCHGWIEPNAAYAGQTMACPHCESNFLMPEVIDPGVKLAPARISAAAIRPMPLNEPWFYGFIDAYARLWTWVSVGLAFLMASAVVIFVLRATAVSPGMPAWMAFVLPCLALVVFAPALLGVIMTGALLRLAVDAARNLRAIRLREMPH